MGTSSRLQCLADEVADYHVVDVHQHLGTWGSFNNKFDGTAPPSIETGAVQRNEFMTAWGIDSAVMHPNQHGPDVEQVRTFNEDVLAARAHGDGRIVGVLASLPLTSETDMTAEFEKIEGDGFVGLSFHNRFTARTLNDPLMELASDLASSRDWPMAVHCVAESSMTAMWRLNALAKRFPKVRYLCLAAFSGPSQAQQCLEVATERPNVYFDTSLMVPIGATAEEFVRVAGTERLVFGTDLYMAPKPIYSCPTPLLDLLSANLSAETKRKVLGTNVRELFQLAH